MTLAEAVDVFFSSEVVNCLSAAFALVMVARILRSLRPPKRLEPPLRVTETGAMARERT
jgi:hypothetical protein